MYSYPLIYYRSAHYRKGAKWSLLRCWHHMVGRRTNHLDYFFAIFLLIQSNFLDLLWTCVILMLRYPYGYKCHVLLDKSVYYFQEEVVQHQSLVLIYTQKALCISLIFRMPSPTSWWILLIILLTTCCDIPPY